ncbi:hypothetical protein A2V54_02880 [candidate division WWE3 bacterium RBG_19FT_COMBO_53_11]|uniref:Beta-glucosidase n=1 Tax=candidate division WWE3 bacterium RBG_19FT_COMBO_53_11 TaxID=1802613 RepID=A0A1F4UH10_UNCKA|nr:MAG: hypothetical protein A2V54_02880 [candidate division WWE3 bacterium RBG_19FT_COMBO_53_11]
MIASSKTGLKSNLSKRFPQGFLWGSASSAHQVEGNNVGSDWWSWEEGGCLESSGVACDHYHRFEEDFDLAKSLNQNAHRLSIEWARIEPEEGRWDGEEIKHYRQVLDSLRSRGIKSFVSLWHFTLPLWFAQKGGFEKASNLKYFERFVRLCAREFGEKVNFWITVNEPLGYAWSAYGVGFWPPQKKHLASAFRVYFNLVRAHRKAYRAIKGVIPRAEAGPALNMAAIHYHGKNPLMVLGVRSFERFFNRSFLFLSRGFFDFIGVNYYFHHDLSLNSFSLEVNKKLAEQMMLMEKKGHGSFFYPRGLYEVLIKLKKYRKPVYITENGIADAKDKIREKFIVGHLSWAHKALGEGIDLRGYLHWSLTDNFEWAFGFKPRFGLVEIDYKTLKRRVRPSAQVYAQVCKTNTVVSDVQKPA